MSHNNSVYILGPSVGSKILLQSTRFNARGRGVGLPPEWLQNLSEFPQIIMAQTV